MGFWNTDNNGNSFASEPDGVDRVWGDGPADTLCDAFTNIVGDFERNVGRRPLLSEMLAGVQFSLPLYTEPMDGDEARVNDDGVVMLVVKKDDLKMLRKVWQSPGVEPDREVVAAVSVLFDGRDGDLNALAGNRFLKELWS